jgi:hypothetical protein
MKFVLNFPATKHHEHHKCGTVSRYLSRHLSLSTAKGWFDNMGEVKADPE